MGQMAKNTKRYGKVVEALRTWPWAILPEKLEVMLAIVNEREGGYTPSREEIEARIGGVRRDEKPYSVINGSAVIPLFGVVSQRMTMFQEYSGGTSTERYGQLIDQAVADDEVERIVMLVDSPGGSVFGLPELFAKIRGADKKVIAMVDALAASAAYHLAAAADEIVATPSALVGSIGVYTMHTDVSKREAEEGITRTFISAGDYKTEGNAYEPLTEEAEAAIQSQIDEFYSVFVRDVAAGRGVNEATVRSGFGRGRVITASAALEEGMIDRIATYEDLLRGFPKASSLSGFRASAEPALSFLQEMDMDPKLFGALYKAGMVAINASEEDAEKALARFFAAKGVEVPESDEAKIDALEGHEDTLIVAEAEDRLEQINAIIKISELNDDEKIDVYQQAVEDPMMTPAKANKVIQDIINSREKVGTSTITMGASQDEKFGEAARSAVLSRVFGYSTPDQIWDAQAKTYVDFKADHTNYALMSLPKLAAACLRHRGIQQSDIDRLAPHQVAQLAMGLASPQQFGIYAAADGPAYNLSGDFANILLDAQNVVLRRSYDHANTTFQVWMRQAPSIADFKEVHSVIAGEVGDPKAIPEDGEFSEAKMVDAKESYKLNVWGQVFSISWQSVVNDQLSAFSGVPAKLGAAMRRKQNRLAYNVLKDNSTMADTGALFNATAQTTAGGHANLSTSTSLNVAGLNSVEQKLYEMKGPGDDNLTNDSSTLNLTPKWLIVPPAMAGTAKELLRSTANPAATNGNPGVVNIWQNGLDMIVEAEIGAAAGGQDNDYYVATDHSVMDHVEYAYLQGLESPALEQEKAFDRLALRQRIYQAFVVHPVEYRGLQKAEG